MSARVDEFEKCPAPCPGDLSLCIHCGTVLVFDGQLHHRLATNTEIEELDDEERVTIVNASKAITDPHLSRAKGDPT